MVRLRTALPLFFLLAILTACAGAAGPGGSAGSSSFGALTQEDLAELGDETTLRTALERLRPRWLTGRGNSRPTQVILNGAPFGDALDLRNIRVSSVAEVRYLNGREATTRYGTGYGDGVVIVTTR